VFPNINWQQGFRGGRTGLIVGRFDPNDYINVLGVSNPWTAFQNLAIVLDASVAFPDTSYGMGAGTYVGKSWYVLGTLNDANGTMADYGFFEGGNEFFKAGEIGWSPSKDERYTRNVNLTYWHVDERMEAGIDSAHGLACAANWTFDKRLMPFLRLGWSEGTAPIYNRSVTAGVVYALTRRSDLAGLAVNWGDPPDDSLKEQITVEGFYRWQFAQNLALTGGLQVLIDPALNPEKDQIWLVSLRARFTY
ncbi:MAG: carbohydrate porin, partial [Actinomycetia bacterium]|nr:carbohydrate porin [Actinomycetes bacterium]